MSAFRLPISFVLSAFATVGLFWFLGILISGRAEHEVVGAIPRIDFTRLVRDSDVETVARVKPEIKKIEPPPSAQNVTASKTASVAQGLDTSALAPAGVDFGGSGEGGLRQGGAPAVAMAGGSDRGPVPQVRIEPDYPPQAKDRGIEGWCHVRFTVTKEGRVKDVVVVAAKPSNIWDRAAIRAVSNWRFQPALKDGKPIETRGVENVVRFELDR